MGILTLGQLLEESLELAGDTSLTPRAMVWVNAALANLYASAAWPFLITRYGAYHLEQGVNTLGTYGDGEGTEDKILFIHKAFMAGMNGQGRRELRVEQALQATAELETLLDDPANTRKGMPTRLIISGAGAPYRWSLDFDTWTDKPYRLAMIAQFLPPPLSLNSDVPAYPNDETIIQCIKAQALFHQSDERWMQEDGKLQAMIRADKGTWAGAMQSEPTVPLGSAFKTVPRR